MNHAPFIPVLDRPEPRIAPSGNLGFYASLDPAAKDIILVMVLLIISSIVTLLLTSCTMDVVPTASYLKLP